MSDFNQPYELPRPDLPVGTYPNFQYGGQTFGQGGNVQVNPIFGGVQTPFAPNPSGAGLAPSHLTSNVSSATIYGGTPAPGTPLPAPGTPLNYPTPGTPYWRDNAAANEGGPGIARRTVNTVGHIAGNVARSVGAAAGGFGGGLLGLFNQINFGQPINQANWQTYNTVGPSGYTPRQLNLAQSGADISQMNTQTALGFGSNYTGLTQDPGHTMFNPGGQFAGQIVDGAIVHRPNSYLPGRTGPTVGGGGSIAQMVGRTPAGGRR